MMQPATARGFADPVLDAQQVFRCAMTAMAQPGRILALAPEPASPPPLAPATAAVALAFCDFETPIWLDARLAASPAVARFLKFHTGAPILGDPAAAAFAILADPAAMPALDVFAQGTAEFPDRSTTLVIQVDTLDDTSGWRLSGPGIAGTARLSASPLPRTLTAALQANHSLFPRGVDCFFAAPGRLAALPRSTAVAI